MLYYTIKDIQEMMGISKNTAYKLARINGVCCMQLGKKLLFEKESFDRWRERHKNKIVELN